jgi:hypothetical protein
VAARVSEIEALRAELEQARAGKVSARAETSPIETIVIPPVIARAEVETREQVPTEPAAQPITPQAPPNTPQTSDEIADPFQARCRAVDEAANLSQVLDALIDGVGTVFPRAALFVVKAKSKRLQGWRSVGFTGVAAITREFEFSLATDSALTRAVSAGRVIFTGETTQGQQAAISSEPWTVTFPVAAGDRVVAVVHADGGGRNGDEAPAFDREAALEVSQRLVRSAGERLVVLTTSARTAFGNVISETPVTPDVVETAAEPARQADPPLDDAGRYASQLVSEINRYKQPVVPEGPPDRNLHERLAGEIEGARDLHAGRAPSVAGGALGVFDEALGKMLGNGDVDVRGLSEQATAAGQPVLKVQT